MAQESRYAKGTRAADISSLVAGVVVVVVVASGEGGYRSGQLLLVRHFIGIMAMFAERDRCTLSLEAESVVNGLRDGHGDKLLRAFR